MVVFIILVFCFCALVIFSAIYASGHHSREEEMEEQMAAIEEWKERQKHR